MVRTKLDDRKLPDYTRGEEIFNMASHIVGSAFGVAVLILCIVFSLLYHNFWGLLGGTFYGVMMIFLYTVSSVYHGLIPERPKKVMQVLDHCSIYALIVGTYAPVLLTGIRANDHRLFWIVTVVVLTGTVIGVVFTAIDFHRYAPFAMSGYFVVGWCIIFAIRSVIRIFGIHFFLWLLAGGIAYTLGMIFFTIGIKKHYYHSIFHLFIVAGSVLQFVGIFKYCIAIG